MSERIGFAADRSRNVALSGTSAERKGAVHKVDGQGVLVQEVSKLKKPA